jgi:hypothetical protein
MRALKLTRPRGSTSRLGPRGCSPRRGAGALSVTLIGAALFLPAASGGTRLGRTDAILARGLDYTLALDAQVSPLIAGRHIGSFQQALQAFGAAKVTSSTVAGQSACQAVWSRLGLAIDFAAVAAASCTATEFGSWLKVTATRRRWHTSAGLHVGDPEQRLHTFYPQARLLDFLGGGGHLWQLQTGGPYCDGGPPLALAGRVSRGRVAALEIVHVPACG